MANNATIQETIRFMTQIHTGYDGCEQRMALRFVPRRSVCYTYTGMNAYQSQYLRGRAYSGQTTTMEFPLWHAQKILPLNLAKSESIILLEKADMWDYRDCHAVLLFNGDEEGGIVYPVASLDSDGKLHLGKQLTEDYAAKRVVLVPVFMGLLKPESNHTSITSQYSEMDLSLDFYANAKMLQVPEALDEYNYERPKLPHALNAPDTHNGRELFLLKPEPGDNNEVSYSRNAEALDNETGGLFYDLKSAEITTRKNYEFICANKEELHFIQRFFYRCMGQLKLAFIGFSTK